MKYSIKFMKKGGRQLDAEGFLGQIGAVDIFGIAFAFDETFLSP